MEEPVQLRKKICMLGDSAVGKSSLIRRFVFNEFDEKYITTIGTNVSKKDLNVVINKQENELQNYEVTLAIWDIIGQRDFHSFNLNYFRAANGGLVVCDITRRETLENLDMWASSFRNNIGQVPLVFLVNKYDLSENGAFDEEEINTSAMTGENVESAFHTLGELMVKKETTTASEDENKVSKAASEIIIEFSNYVGGIERGIPLIKEIFKVAGVDFSNPQNWFNYYRTYKVLRLLIRPHIDLRILWGD
jgi:small GTP-binding protein